MDYSCPHCGSSLKKTAPQLAPTHGAGQLRLARTVQMHLECASCSQPVDLNFHPVERGITYASVACFLLLTAASAIEWNARLFWLGVIIMAGTELGVSVWTRVFLQEWKRYAAAPAQPGTLHAPT